MRSLSDITQLLSVRRAERGQLMEAARVMSNHYNGRITIPLPELNDNEPAAVANLIGQGIDQHAMRIASHMPDITCPPVRPGDAPEQRAKSRRLACYGWLETNGVDLLQGKRARQFVAYAGSPVWLRADKKLKVPAWDVQSFLDTYPSPPKNPLDYRPDDCIFIVTRTWRWLTKTYPTQANVIKTLVNSNTPLHDDDLIELAKYVDDTEIVLVAVGRGQMAMHTQAEYGIGGAQIVQLGSFGQRDSWGVELERDEHYIGQTPVVFPHRLSLDSPKGQFDDTLGMFQMQARLMALEVNAAAKAVYPDTWMVERLNESAEIVTMADGLRGIIGYVKGAQIENLQTQPGVQTGPIMDRLERGMRQNAAIPADFGGESGTNIRTDARGQSVLAAAVDFHIDEAQRIFARSLKAELEIAADIDKAYWGKVKKSYWVTWGGAPGRLDYTPDDVWGEDKTILVTNAFSGLDINARQVAIGQMVAGGQLSTETAMEQNPLIMDKFREKARIVGEGLEKALLASLQSMAEQGAIHAVDIGFILRTMRGGEVSLEDAVDQAQARAQERQASSGEPGTPAGPAEPGSPDAQPGIAAGGGQPPATVDQPPAGLDNLKAQLRDLTAGQQLTGARYNGAA